MVSACNKLKEIWTGRPNLAWYYKRFAFALTCKLVDAFAMLRKLDPETRYSYALTKVKGSLHRVICS